MKKVTITYEFESCRWCPFKSEFRDMGCSDTLCGKQEEMRSIYNKNTIKDCPLKDNEEVFEIRKEC